MLPTSVLSFGPNHTPTNSATVRLAADGTIKVSNAAGSTEVIIDVNGWYGGTTATAGSGFTATELTKVLDTRSATRTGQCSPGSCSTLGKGSTSKA